MKRINFWYPVVTILIVCNLALVILRFVGTTDRSRTSVIFVPVSPELERRIRERQPARGLCSDLGSDTIPPHYDEKYKPLLDRAPDELLADLLDLENRNILRITEEKRTRLRERATELSNRRKKVLELRNQRHALNTLLMQEGVALTKELTPPELDYILANRDAIAYRYVEQEVWDDLLNRLTNDENPP